ncbi:EGF-like repeat and discoidin I-like domain-containing protein 3 [Lingula anatina]|uniref:EGF-like repeat and discoidin I-like domain-containing protein 3 n=1 Tax=Lingula anatina TaxID=7574 RepID=A0A1S3ILQ3_LINAN|nr:EGF-like repeat and discoidin I-like domain-containing protein 3 [Lingula anatina]|eukprot:XP_013399147.1 EGF-like repeat and discoidin I-like domain-containing protein 3 [Lingula anatina]
MALASFIFALLCVSELSTDKAFSQVAPNAVCSCQEAYTSEDGTTTVVLQLPKTSTAVSTGNKSLSELDKLKQNYQKQAQMLSSQGLLLMQQAKQIQQIELELQDLKLSISKPPADCQDLLVSGNTPISDSQITASSMYNSDHGPAHSRLYTNMDNHIVGSWSARTNDNKQWLQFDFGRVRKLTAILTKGRNQIAQFVKTYQIHYGNNTLLMKGYRDGTGSVKIFQGNIDLDNIHENVLNPPVYARYLRINPLTWYGHISVRADVLGC